MTRLEDEVRRLRKALERTSDQLARTQHRSRLLAQRLEAAQQAMAEREACIRQLEHSEREARHELRSYEWQRQCSILSGRRPGGLQRGSSRYVGMSCLRLIDRAEGLEKRPPVGLKSIVLAVLSAAVAVLIIYFAIVGHYRARQGSISTENAAVPVRTSAIRLEQLDADPD